MKKLLLVALASLCLCSCSQEEDKCDYNLLNYREMEVFNYGNQVDYFYNTSKGAKHKWADDIDVCSYKSITLHAYTRGGNRYRAWIEADGVVIRTYVSNGFTFRLTL